MKEAQSGHLYGVHRVILPDDVLPLYAAALDNTSSLCKNELLLEIQYIALHPHFIRQLFAEANNDSQQISGAILQRIARYGKLSGDGTPVGYAIGKVTDIGETYHPVVGETPSIGDTLLVQSDLATLPLLLEEIKSFHFDSGIVEVRGQSFLSPSISMLNLKTLPEEHTHTHHCEGNCHAEKTEKDNIQSIASIFLPLQYHALKHVIEKGIAGARRILILGSSRNALMCAAIVKKSSLFSSIYGFDTHVGNLVGMRSNGGYDVVGIGEVHDAVTTLDGTLKMTGDELVDVVIHATYEPCSELSAILPVQDGGRIIIANNSPIEHFACAAGAIGRKVNIETSMQAILGITEYQASYSYFMGLLQSYPALRAVLS